MLNLLHCATELLFQSYEKFLYLVSEYASVEITNIKTKQIIILFVKHKHYHIVTIHFALIQKDTFINDSQLINAP